MDPSYAKVSDLLAEDEFRRRVRAFVDEFGGLIDEQAAALLVLEELGRYEPEFQRLADLEEGGSVSLRVRVVDVPPPREFDRRDGARGKVLNVLVADDSGRCRLVLWDEEADTIGGTLQRGDRLRLIDCLLRRTAYGVEVTRGRRGLVVKERPRDVSPSTRKATPF